MELTRPRFSEDSVIAAGRAVLANRWRVGLLRRAAAAIGGVLDDAHNWPPLSESTRAELLAALAAIVACDLGLVSAAEGAPHDL